MAPQQGYDPQNPQPYQAPQLPDVVSPVIQQAEQKQQDNAPNIQRGPMNQLGGWAEIGDNLFRGYMRGKAEKSVKDAIGFKRQDDALQASYNLSAQQLKSMHDSGVDPNSDAYKQAQQAVQGSWGALMQFRGSHIPGVNDPGMKGKKRKPNDAPPNILEQLASDDPMQKMQGAYAAMMKLGPPVMYQLGDQKLAQTEHQINALRGQNELSTQQLEAEKNTLAAIPAAQRTPEQSARYTELTTKPVQPQPGDEKLKAQDSVYTKLREKPDYELTDNDRMVLGIGPKTQVHVTSRGEVIATSETADGTGSYQVLRGPQEEYQPSTKKADAPKIPKSVADKIVSQKNDAITQARNQFLNGDKYSKDPKKQKIGFDEYVDRWQQAQDKYEERIETMTGEPTAHLDIRSNVDKQGNWTGPKESAHQGGETGGIPNNLAGQKPTAGASMHGQEELGLPPEIAKQLKPGFVSTLSDGSRWTVRNGKPLQVSAPAK